MEYEKLKKQRDILIIILVILFIALMYLWMNVLAWKDVSANYCELNNDQIDLINNMIENGWFEGTTVTDKITKLNCPERVYGGS
ncbi:MAG TPA: hypothetical protein VJ912_00095 [Candidatus Nanoarchaeia archaeon]|nr:hypothetical protein [Candidatus Nanoarchaeia archaeon]